MSKITIDLKECSIHDVNKLIELIKKNKIVQDAYLVQSISGLTQRTPDACPEGGLHDYSLPLSNHTLNRCLKCGNRR